ncbi:MAG: DUF1847 domain-containing protein [Spirochaetota bacterium]
MIQITECANCYEPVCEKRNPNLASPDCPIKRKPGIMKKGLRKSLEPELKEFARQAAIQQSEAFIRSEDGIFARYSRLEETILFAKKMGYKRLGLAFCSALRNESILVNKILENHGFEVVSVCCKVGGLSGELIGITNEDISRGSKDYTLMCNPVTQAEIMNDEGAEFNIVIGLCVGHDSLFIKHANALSTVLIAKDHVFGHNPAAVLKLSGPYCKKFMQFRKE